VECLHYTHTHIHADHASRELARANVQIKELQQSLAKYASEVEERDVVAKSTTARLSSLAAALQVSERGERESARERERARESERKRERERGREGARERASKR